LIGASLLTGLFTGSFQNGWDLVEWVVIGVVAVALLINIVDGWFEWRARHASSDSVFDFFEVVRVRATPKTISDGIAGLEGAILGKAAEDDGPVVGYAVSLYERRGETWSLEPDELEPTGRHDRRESFYDGTSVKVSARGELVEWNEPPDQH
jgi:hypothetical protein